MGGVQSPNASLAWPRVILGVEMTVVLVAKEFLEEKATASVFCCGVGLVMEKSAVSCREADNG